MRQGYSFSQVILTDPSNSKFSFWVLSLPDIAPSVLVCSITLEDNRTFYRGLVFTVLVLFRRLIEKQQRVIAIAASLEQSGADPEQKQEVEDMITPSERSQLDRVKHITNK